MKISRDRPNTLLHMGSLGVLLCLLGLWQVAAVNEWLPRVFFPAPSAVAQAMKEELLGGELGHFAWQTVRRMLYGWVVASAIGVALGALIGISAGARIWLQPMLEFIRPMPASAIIPVAIALFGLSPIMVLMVIAFGSLWPVLLATIHGFASVEARLVEVAVVLRLSRLAYIFKIGLPNALPDIFAGMRLSLTVALILTTVGEMLASQPGLGTYLLISARSFQADNLFAGVAALSLIGFTSNLLLVLASRRALTWQGRF